MLDEHHIDYFHIDSNDDLNVFEDIKTIRSISKIPIDLHIISSTPEKFFPFIQEYQIEYVTFQYENLTEPLEIPKEIKSHTGLSIISETPFEVFEQYANRFSFILFMATTPGISGGSFNKENFRKIRQFQKHFPNKKIHVDGGVNNELSFILKNMGVSTIVVGSYLFTTNYLGVSLLNLKSDHVESHFLVKDIMLTSDLPLLSKYSNGFKEVLLSIEKHNMGFTIITDENNKMEGIITNADIRRCLIKKYNDFEHIGIEDAINRNPVFINENKTVTDLLKLVRSLSFPLLYMPVTDDYRRVVGAITFNNLVKGES